MIVALNEWTRKKGRLSVACRGRVGDPPNNSPRIVAQRGVFTIFGKRLSPMEETFQEGGFPSESLTKLILPASEIDNLRDSLFAIGFTESVIFPDLDGLAEELQRHFGFGR